MSTRATIIADLVAGLKGLSRVKEASSRPKMPASVGDYLVPYVAVVVEDEDALFEGSSKFKALIALYILTNESFNAIEDLISDIKDYIKSASITNASELRMGEPVHEVVGVEDAQKIAGTKMNVVLVYKEDNNDTPANKYPSSPPVGYMAIAKYKEYALMASGSTTFQALGTNVYDSHINANLEIPAGSGSISVDLVDAPVIEWFRGRFDNIKLDDNAIQISIRAHFAKGVNNTVIAPFMWSIVNLVRKNVNLGDDYKMLGDEFIPEYNLVFEESATVGAKLTFNVLKGQYYEQS